MLIKLIKLIIFCHLLDISNLKNGLKSTFSQRVSPTLGLWWGDFPN